MIGSASVEEVLLVLKVLFLVFLYIFIWRIVRTAARDLRVPQESFVLAPQAGGAGALAPRPPVARLVVIRSRALAEGADHVLNSAPVTVGRGPQNDIELAGDEFASANHARLEPRGDGIWLYDVGSTNGTYVNGQRISRSRKLRPGDVVRVGETDFRFEQ